MVVKGAVLKVSRLSDTECSVLLLHGPQAILKWAPLLQQLASRCGQPGAMHWLDYYLSSEQSAGKLPCLVLALTPNSGENPSTTRPDDLLGAALLFEYQIRGIRTGAFATFDSTGYRNVVAPAHLRAAMAALAAEAVLARGAHVVLVSVLNAATDPTALRPLPRTPGLLWTQQQRAIKQALQLGNSMNETLARMGKTTRTNMRFYRKRLLKKLPLEVVSDARGQLSEGDVRLLNRTSLNQAPYEQIRQSYTSASELPGGFLLGLRHREGQWLSLAGGWRQDRTTILEWQLNVSGYEKDSLGSVMRSFLMEHEIERGARRLIILGGTKHSMAHAFESEMVTDLVVRRNSLRVRLFQWLARLYTRPQPGAVASSFLAPMLCDPRLLWQPIPEPSRSTHKAAQRNPSKPKAASLLEQD